MIKKNTLTDTSCVTQLLNKSSQKKKTSKEKLEKLAKMDWINTTKNKNCSRGFHPFGKLVLVIRRTLGRSVDRSIGYLLNCYDDFVQNV